VCSQVVVFYLPACALKHLFLHLNHTLGVIWQENLCHCMYNLCHQTGLVCKLVQNLFRSMIRLLFLKFAGFVHNISLRTYFKVEYLHFTLDFGFPFFLSNNNWENKYNHPQHLGSHACWRVYFNWCPLIHLYNTGFVFVSVVW